MDPGQSGCGGEVRQIKREEEAQLSIDPREQAKEHSVEAALEQYIAEAGPRFSAKEAIRVVAQKLDRELTLIDDALQTYADKNHRHPAIQYGTASR